MNMQFVFGNPTSKGKRKMAKKKKGSKRRKTAKAKRKNPVTRSVSGRKKIGSKTVGGTTTSILSRRKSVGSKTTWTKAELSRFRAALADSKASIAELALSKKLSKSKATKKKLTTRLKKSKSLLTKALKMYKTKSADRSDTNTFIKDLKTIAKTDGLLAIKVKQEFKGIKGVGMAKKKKKKAVRRKKTASKKRRKKVVKKSSAKKTRKKTRRKSSKKRRKSAVKTKASLRVGKKRTTAKISGATKKLRKKGSSVRKKFRRGKKKYTASIRRNPKRSNPVLGQDVFSKFKAFGPMAGQMSALMVGGAFYGYSNQLMSKYARPVYDAFQAVPVVGATLPNLLLGVGMTLGAKKIKNKLVSEILMTMGQGMIGSAAVGIGVNASQYVPMLSGGMSGIQYTPMSGVDYIKGGGRSIAGSASSGDFAAIPQGLSGVDYTPQMGSVDFTPEMGEYEQADADYGFENPEGMF